jgi:MFS transporter, putative metabolite transport protein
MNDTAEIALSEQTGARTVQEYIDEIPAWPDGAALKSAPMTAMQWSIFSLAAAG